MARTAAIGLRRDPHPPMPMVIPLRNSPTSSSSDSRLSVIVRTVCRAALLDEGGPLLVGHAGHVELVGEPLFEPVAPPDVDRVDPVEGLLGPADDGRALGGDVGRHLVGGVDQLVAGERPGAPTRSAWSSAAEAGLAV